MSEIKGNKKIVGKINAKTLRATTNIPEWLQPLIKENGVYVGTEPPTDPNKLVWINPDGQATIYVKDASITDDILKIIKSDGTTLSFAGGSATSPTIETEEVENGVKLIITDLSGTKEVIISNGKDGIQGPVGPAGPSGPQGESGLPGKDGQDGLPGQPGKDGVDGFSPSASVESNSEGAVITITDAKGTTTAQIYNGSNGLPGADGLDGQDGFSPTVELTDTDTGVTLTITDVNGAKTATINDGAQGPQGVPGADGHTPQKGVDYWTLEDKQEIIDSIPSKDEVHVGPEAPTKDEKIWVDTDADNSGLAELIGCYTKSEVDAKIPDVSNFATNESVDEKISGVTIPVATTETAGKVKPDGTTITVDADGTIHSAGGGGGSVNIDNKTIIQNEDGTISTAIGGEYVDGLVESDYLLEIAGDGNTFRNKDLSDVFTYDLAKFIYNYESIIAECKTGYGEFKDMVVTKTLTTTDDTEVYNFKHGVYDGDTSNFTYTGTYTISTGTWVMIANMTKSGVYYDKFYTMIPGKVPSPIISANFLPLSEDFTVDSNKLKLNWLQLTANKGFNFSYNKNNINGEMNGKNSLSGGIGSYVSGINGISWGSNVKGNGRESFLFGNQLYGNSNYDTSYSFVTGTINNIKSPRSFVAGYYNNWYGNNPGVGVSIFGQGNTPYSDWCFNTGKWSAFDTNKEYAHIIGNGTDNNNRSNAYTLDWSGNATFAGTVSSAGADYAEFFEWKDGNTEAEDRVGYIVTLDGDKIKLASSDDDILGIVSGTATVLGDNAEWYWNKRYETDDFGRVIYEDREIVHEAVYNPDSELIEEEKTEIVHAPKINPAYDPNKPYINRRNRPEWSAVGMMGKLYVRDDGTAQVNGYVTAKDGIATHSDSKTNMRVMKRVKDNIILVCLK